MTLGAAWFCVAGAALGAPQARFARQAQHLEHLRLVLRGRCSTWSTSGSFCVAGAALGARQARFCVAGAALGAPPARFAWQAQHLEHLRLVLRGRHSTWSTSGSFCVPRAALGAPSTQHHLHYIIRHTIINTTPSPQHHQHNLINT